MEPIGQQLVYPGMKLDRYELVCPIAYGGMGTVWLARYGGKLGFEKVVVLKMILPQYAQDPEARRMFIDEARIASRIEHPNVVRITDVGEVGGTYYLAMDYVDGDSLSRLLSTAADRGMPRFPTSALLSVMGQVCAGLHAAHEVTDDAGELLHVVHRDVSPQNVLIGPTGQAMLIDFGVVKARVRVSQDTRTGQLKGKLAYMAPEQSRGKFAEVDRRADVWAVGAVLYEHFTGAPPFEAASDVATIQRLADGVPPAPLPESVPAPIAAVVMHALAIQREARFPTTLALKEALETAAHECGLRLSSVEVVAFAEEALADRRAARKRNIDTSLAALRERTDSLHRAAVAHPSAPLGVDTLAPDVETLKRAPATGLDTPLPEEHMPSYAHPPAFVSEQDTTSHWSRSSLLLGIVGGIAVGTLLAVLVARGPSASPGTIASSTNTAANAPLPSASMPAGGNSSSTIELDGVTPSPDSPSPDGQLPGATTSTARAPTSPAVNASTKIGKHTSSPAVTARGNPSSGASPNTYGF